MDYETIRHEVTDGVARITLNRPEVMNALNSQMRAELLHAVRESYGQARVILMTGEGRSFCSGQDLGDSTAANADLERALRDEYAPLIRAIAEAPIPTVSAVNGAAAGAGANLALAADVVIATESAYFLQAFARIGLMPDAGGTWVLPHTMGLAKAMGAALFADKITAREAERMGMIWEAVPDEEFAGHVARRVGQLAQGPTEAYRRIKEGLRAAYGSSFPDQLDREAKLQGKLGQTRDFREGVVAFLEKRPSKFEGR